MHILVADDDRDILALLRLQLESLGHTLQCVERGDEAWQAIQSRQHDFDLILLDLQMPGEDGLSVLRRLRDFGTQTPVAIISGRSDSEQVMAALRLQAFDYLVKPFSQQQLETLLSRLEVLREVDLGARLSAASELLYQERLCLTFASRLSLVKIVVQRIVEHVRPFHRAHAVRVDAVALALTEAMTNAVIHGNLGIPGDLKEQDWDGYYQLIEQREQCEPYCQREVSVEVELQQHALLMSVRDQGEGFDAQQLQAPDDPLESLGGRGITLMRHLMDSVQWLEQGRCVRMLKSLRPAD